jgi:hypothetical protein
MVTFPPLKAIPFRLGAGLGTASLDDPTPPVRVSTNKEPELTTIITSPAVSTKAIDIPLTRLDPRPTDSIQLLHAFKHSIIHPYGILTTVAAHFFDQLVNS